MYSSHHILSADGTLAHALAALGARDHVPTLQQHAVDDGVHADPAQAVVFFVLQLQPLAIWKATTSWGCRPIGPAAAPDLLQAPNYPVSP